MTEEETRQELQLGLDELNAAHPPEYWPSPLLAIYRHPCMGARIAKKTGRAVSTAIDLKEIYVTRWLEGFTPLADTDDTIAMLYREGTCRACGQTARSPKGRFVLTAERPPVLGRVARG